MHLSLKTRISFASQSELLRSSLASSLSYSRRPSIQSWIKSTRSLKTDHLPRRIPNNRIPISSNDPPCSSNVNPRLYNNLKQGIHKGNNKRTPTTTIATLLNWSSTIDLNLSNMKTHWKLNQAYQYHIQQIPCFIDANHLLFDTYIYIYISIPIPAYSKNKPLQLFN